jgi:hypothetical protein
MLYGVSIKYVRERDGRVGQIILERVGESSVPTRTYARMMQCVILAWAMYIINMERIIVQNAAMKKKIVSVSTTVDQIIIHDPWGPRTSYRKYVQRRSVQAWTLQQEEG